MAISPPDEIQGTTLYFPHAETHLHSMLSGCGIETRRHPALYNNYGLGRGEHPYCIWQYTLEGEGELTLEGRLFRIHPGDAMCLLIPQDHRYRLPEDSPKWKFIYLSLSGSEILRIWKEISRRFGPVVKLPLERSKAIERAFDIVSTAQNKKVRSAYHASQLAYSFVMSFYEEIEILRFAASEAGFVLDAVKFCMDHYAEGITVDDIADAAGYSRSHFTRMFTSVQGVSPGRYLREVRLGNAARMLQLESGNVKEIALRCGFPDESYFCKAFRLRYGVTPDLFRKKR